MMPHVSSGGPQNTRSAGRPEFTLTVLPNRASAGQCSLPSSAAHIIAAAPAEQKEQHEVVTPFEITATLLVIPFEIRPAMD